MEVSTRELVPGDFVAVTIGMNIPADGIVVSEGDPLQLDYSSLTGESIPEKNGKGDVVLSAAVVLVGEGEMVVTKTGIDSSLGTTQALIAEAKKAKGEWWRTGQVAFARCGFFSVPLVRWWPSLSAPTPL